MEWNGIGCVSVNISHGKDAAGESFAQDDDVGADVLVIDGQTPASSGQTRLHFIGNPQDVVLGAQLPHTLQTYQSINFN